MKIEQNIQKLLQNLLIQKICKKKHMKNGILCKQYKIQKEKKWKNKSNQNSKKIKFLNRTLLEHNKKVCQIWKIKNNS